MVQVARRGGNHFILALIGIGGLIAACSDESGGRGGLNDRGDGSGTLGGGNGNGVAGNPDDWGGALDIPGPDDNGAMGGGPQDIDHAGKVHPPVIDDCPGNVPGGSAQALVDGGSPQGVRWLYPYDGTIFPRGLASPMLQWEQSGPIEAVHVRIRSQHFHYQGCFANLDGPRLQLPQHAWEAAGEWNEGRGDPATVELTTLSGGTVRGPISQQWNFALASIHGAIYYNTYNSPLAGNNGAVLRILPGQAQPEPYIVEAGVPPMGPCVSCHSVSANGSMMTAARHFYPGGYESLSYEVTPTSPPPVANPALHEAGFSGIFPDGSRYMSNGTPYASTSIFFPVNDQGNVPAMVGPTPARLHDTRTGAQIPAPGWDGAVVHAQMPSFSPNGRLIVFNDHDAGSGHALFVMDFDPATNTFSNKREIFRHNTLYPGWPFFTPDSQAVVFALGTRSDFVSQLPDPNLVAFPDQVGRSHLRMVHLQTGADIPLDALNGYRGGQSYLPHPNDNDYEFFPTVSPVAAGGYFWVFFTSRRNYGNMLNLGADDPDAKKIWVSAVNIGVGDRDPSHPAFYLPGQELHSGNVRAFAALEPCKEDGESCTSGTECCNGFCVDGICQPPQECAQLDDRCETHEDCCESTHNCIGGFCHPPVPR